jgi:hypothetical protein
LKNTGFIEKARRQVKNAGFFTGFSGKQAFSLKMSIFGGQYQ